LAFNFSSVSEAQTIKGKLNIKRQTNKQVDLYRTEGKYKYKVDSTKVLTDGSFTFKYKKHLKGFYKLTLGNENNIVDVILNSSEPVVSLAFSQIRLEKGIEVIQSNENKAYWEFKKEDSAVQSKIKNLKKQRGQFKSQANEAKVNEMTNEIIKLEKELFDFVQTVINKYPTTFFSKTKIASLSKTPKDKATYFDDLDFSNESFIRSDVYATRFQDYIIKHSGHTEVGYYNAVDDIMKKSKVNEKVFEFALYNLLDGFYGSGLEDVATYIMEEYFYGEACGEIEINDLLRSKADLIKNLQIGNIPPDFTIKSNYGADVNLKNTCANNKYTVIMFWATHCPHCMRDLPGFVPVYNEYKSKGLEVIGVALDVNQTKWKNTIEEKGFNWKNVSQFGNYKSPVCIDYKINKTPSWFILDSSMKIIAKPKGKQEILRFLKNNL
jgi:peroxiredoxin